MSITDKKPIRTFIMLTYIIFWILFSITGIIVFTDAPQIYQVIMKNVCSWASTFALLLLFKRFKPNVTVLSFLKQQFTKVTFLDFFIPMILQTMIAVLAIILVVIINKDYIETIEFISVSSILPFLLINITSGPMGEELGWRSYALVELNKKFNLFISSILIGFLWGLWHFPLWLVSGFSGFNLLFYVFSFMLAIISFSVFTSYFYNKKRNILVAVWIHFLFNVLMQVVIFDDNKLVLLMFFVALLYFIVSMIIVIKNKNIFFLKPFYKVAKTNQLR